IAAHQFRASSSQIPRGVYGKRSCCELEIRACSSAVGSGVALIITRTSSWSKRWWKHPTFNLQSPDKRPEGNPKIECRNPKGASQLLSANLSGRALSLSPSERDFSE